MQCVDFFFCSVLFCIDCKAKKKSLLAPTSIEKPADTNGIRKLQLLCSQRCVCSCKWRKKDGCVCVVAAHVHSAVREYAMLPIQICLLPLFFRREKQRRLKKSCTDKDAGEVRVQKQPGMHTLCCTCTLMEWCACVGVVGCAFPLPEEEVRNNRVHISAEHRRMCLIS